MTGDRSGCRCCGDTSASISDRPRTMTSQAAQPSQPTQTITSSSTGTLRLRGEHTDNRRVAWSANTVDNENCGRKSSKICCIYHKPKEFDESSSSSSDEDSEDEHDKALREKMRRLNEKKKAQHKDCTCDDNPKEGTERNAYEK